MKKNIQKIIEKAILNLQKKGEFPDFKIPEIKIDYPGDKKFGDYSSNIAMILAGKLKRDPMEIAASIKQQACLPDRQALSGKHKEISKIKVVKPGYINFYLSEKYLQDLVNVINKRGNKYGNNKTGENKKVLIEFISSNPTGPIHLGNGRGGPLGDTLANVLEKSGYQAEKEFFINDFGNQVEILGHSILKDKDAQYKGDYIDKLAEKLKNEKGVKNKTDAKEIGQWAAEIIIEKIIKPTCEKMGVKFNNWFSEKDLHSRGETEEIIKLLEKKDLVYKKDEAVWYKSTKYDDDKDRVLIKSDGNKTYIAVDLAYHKNKIKRGFNKLINIQGADHHKEAEVVKNFVEKILGEKNKLDYILNQFVRIVKDGEEIKMSKRKGTYFAMDDLIKEVGIDAARFIFLSYAPNTHINFDINLAKEQSEKNPVYYVQYAHARIAGILVKSEKLKVESEKKPSLDLPLEKGERIGTANLNLLVHKKELDLMGELNKFPELIEEIARSYETHKLPHYAIKLADKFHSFYAECRVIDEDNLELSLARQNLINAVRIVLAEVLRLIGVSAPKHM
ncbi:arginine--tRNA ligase [bacterium]|nr:arginine--tRNA ligase [bacterium]